MGLMKRMDINRVDVTRKVIAAGRELRKAFPEGGATVNDVMAIADKHNLPAGIQDNDCTIIVIFKAAKGGPKEQLTSDCDAVWKRIEQLNELARTL